jgi:signal transduction histidine kinase
VTVGVISAILAAIVSLTVAIAILIRRPRRPLYGRFAAFSFSLFLWHGASVASPLSVGPVVRLQIGAALALVPTSMLVFNELLRDHSAASRRLARLAFLASGTLLVLVISPWGLGFPVRAVATTYVLGGLALVLHSLFSRSRDARVEAERKRTHYLLFGGLVALVLASGELLPGAGLPAAMGHLAATFYLYFLYQSIISRRVIDLVELLGKAAVLGVMTLVLATAYFLLVWWVGSDEPGVGLFNTLVASFVILILFDQVRPWIERTTVRLIFRRRHELTAVLRRLLRTLRTTISVDEMVEIALGALHDSGRAEDVSIFMPEEGELSFVLAGYRGAKPPQVLTVAQQPELLQELRRERRPILLEHLVDRYQDLPAAITDGDPTLQRDQQKTGEAIATMRALGANIVLPMLAGDRIVGVLAVGADPTGAAFTTDEIAALLTAADACAAVIENSQEYERLRERDRLVAVGEVAAGIAHEIRNPLGAIKAAAQCLEPGTPPREAAEYLQVIVEEVDRLNGVLSQFLEYARPYRGNPIPTDVNDVVSATLRLLGKEAVPDRVTVRQDLGHALPPVSVDPEQLKQVLINLVLNAIQAMPEAGEITITTLVAYEHHPDVPDAGRDLANASVLVRVRDSGIGISADDIPRVFMPFFTTKPNGTGLGLAISHRIIEANGGRLEVASRQAQGTTFTIRLPALSPQPERTDPEREPQPSAAAVADAP